MVGTAEARDRILLLVVMQLKRVGDSRLRCRQLGSLRLCFGFARQHLLLRWLRLPILLLLNLLQ